jgi:hypothetical protein
VALVFAPDGTPGEVPDEKLQRALGMGYKPRTLDPARVEAADQPIQAAAEGVFRGATMGFGEGIANAFEEGYTGKSKARVQRETLLRKEENPWASGLGEVGGAVGVSALTGGGASALVGGGLRGAALETGLYGMGSMVSESTLENTDLTADRLAAGFVGGALVGGVGHGGISLLGKGVSLLGKGVSVGISKFGGKGLRDTLGKVADDAEWGMLKQGWSKGETARNEPYKEFMLKFGRETGITGRAGTAFDDATLAKAQEVATGYAKKIAGEMTELEGYVPLKSNAPLRDEYASFVERDLEKQFKNSPAHEEALKSAKKYTESLRNVDRTWGEAWGVQSSLFKEKVSDTASGEVREALRQSMRNFVIDEVASGKNKAGSVLTAVELKLKSGVKSLPPAVARPVSVNLDEAPISAGGVFERATTEVVEGMHPALKGTTYTPPAKVPLGRAIPGSLGGGHAVVEGATSQPGGVFHFPGTEAMLGAGPSAGAKFALPKPKFYPFTVRLGEKGASTVGGLKFALPEVRTPALFGAQLRRTGQESRAASALLKSFKSRALASSGGEYGLGSLAGLTSGNPLAVVAGRVAETQMRKRGGFLAATALRRMADSKVTAGVSKNLSAHIGKVLAVAPEILGAYKYPLAAAMAQGADALLEEHIRLASGPTGHDYLSKAALEVETPEQVDAAGARLAVLDMLEQHSTQGEQETTASIDAMFGSAPGRKGSLGTAMSPKAFNTTRTQLDALLTNPEKAFEQLPPEVTAAAPMLAAQMSAKVLEAARYLDSVSPKDPEYGMSVALKQPWQPSAADLDKFSRTKEALENPARVLKNMSQGYISSDQIDAIRAVYPAMYVDFQQRLSDRLMEWKKPLTYQQRLAFSPFLGPAVLGVSPQQVQILQELQQKATGNQPESGGMKPPDGRQRVDQESNLQTQAQRLEGR